MEKKIIIKKAETIEECRICNRFLEELSLYETQFDDSIFARENITNFYERTLNRKDSVIFLATLNNECVGYIMAYKHEPKELVKRNFITIMNIYIKPEHRDVGIGRLLIEKVESWAKQEFSTFTIELDCFVDNKTAIEFYSKLNFKPVRVKMRKTI